MGVAFADYDGDGYTDMFVSNDTFRNFLFHNERNGTFTETAILNGVAYNENGKSIAGMGCDFRDVDNDGRPDIFVVAMVGDTWPLFRNRGRDFQDMTSSSGVARASAPYTAWGAGVYDFDNDGWKDLFVSRASILDNSEEIEHLPSKLPNTLLRNLGGKKFADASAVARDRISRCPQRHRGAAFGDLNNDGKIDIVVTSQQVKPEIYINRSSNTNHWLLVELTGTKSNRDGLGARIDAHGGRRDAVQPGDDERRLRTASDRRVHFGLGAARDRQAGSDLAERRAPVADGVKADQVLKVREYKPDVLNSRFSSGRPGPPRSPRSPGPLRGAPELGITDTRALREGGSRPAESGRLRRRR